MVACRATALLFMLLCSVKAAAAVFGLDDRVAVSVAPGSPFSPIGLVYPASRSHYATGFLVGRCHVLTVKHVVGDDASARNKSLLFSVGPRPIKGRWTSKGIVVADGNFRSRANSHEPGQGRYRDWLLLRLDRCLGAEFGFLRLGDEQLRIGQLLESAGYPRDRSLIGPTIDPHCAVRAWVGSTVLHDCASRQGSSGGPIFKRVRQGDSDVIEVVAMHSAGVPDRGVRPFDYAFSSIAIPIRSILPLIAPYLDEGDRLLRAVGNPTRTIVPTGDSCCRPGNSSGRKEGA
jgi:V8-like Glu-specific endopeptidase